MKLLFILDSVEFPLAPNPILARRVAACLAQRGHSVHLLELWDGKTQPPPAPGCERTLLAFGDERKMNEALEYGRTEGSPLPLRLARLCLHPAGLLAAVRQILLHRPRRVQTTQKALVQLDRQYHFDAVIAVAAPFASAFALEQAPVGSLRLSWQMDPYAANESYTAAHAWDTERRLLTALDGVFVTPAMAALYEDDGPLKAFRSKMRVLDFPSLAPPPGPDQPRQPGRLRCVFVGSLYPQLRTPHYALSLFAALDDPEVELIFVGGGWESYPDDPAASCRKRLGDRLQILGPVPKQEADQWLERADLLLSLGNGVSNQVPSKIFEYFAAGKPILHLAKLENDPCLSYFDRWPLAFSLLEKEGTGQAVCEKLKNFLHQKGLCRLSYKQAEAVFSENTPSHAADCLQQFVEEHSL